MTVTLERSPRDTISPELNGHDIVHYDLDPDVLERLDLPELPAGIGLMGGAARAVALLQLFGERAPVRDIDVVTFDDIDSATRAKVSEAYMPEDYARGHGIEVTTESKYFSSRDFTINEVVVMDGELRMTTEAFYDLRDKVIRFSHDQIREDGSVSDKLFVKAQLMASVFIVHFDKGEIADSDVWPYDPTDFHYALALNKAFQYGTEVTSQFVGSLDNDPMFFEQVISLAYELSKRFNFSFEGSPFADEVSAYEQRLSRYWDELSDIPAPLLLDEKTEHGVSLMNRYRGTLPNGADGY